mgnify:CR=1 FL=1
MPIDTFISITETVCGSFFKLFRSTQVTEIEIGDLEFKTKNLITIKYKSPILIASAFSMVQPALAFSIISSLFWVAAISVSNSNSSLTGLFHSGFSLRYLADGSER